MARTVAFVLVLCVAIIGVATAAGDCERRATSTAIPCPETWADKAFLIPHEGLRLLTTELSDAVNSPKFDVAAHPWQASTLATWFHSFYLPLVEHHHEVEERLYFPWMESRLAALGKTLPDFPIGHPELMQLLTRTDDAVEALATAEDPAAATAELRASLAAFDGKLLAHLEAEERLLTPLLLAHFTQEENAAVTDRIIQDLGWFGNKAMLPPIFDAMELWGGPEGVEWMASKVPAPIMLMYRLVWTTDRRINSKGALAAVREAQAHTFSLAGLVARHAEFGGLAVFLTIVVAGVFAACRGPSITNPRGSRRKPKKQ